MWILFVFVLLAVLCIALVPFIIWALAVIFNRFNDAIGGEYTDEEASSGGFCD